MEIVGEEIEQAVPVRLVALLDRIDDHHQPARLHDARHLSQHLGPHLLRQLVQKERGNDEVEAAVVEGQRLGRGLFELHARCAADQAACLFQIGRTEVDAGEPQARPRAVQEGEQPAGAAADIQAPEFALVAALQPFGDRLQGPPAHGVGGAGEENLDLGVVDRGRFFGQPAAALEMKILPVVARQVSVGVVAVGFVVDAAVPAGIDLGQVAEVKRTAAQQFGRIRAGQGGGGEKPGGDILPFPLEQATQVGRQLGSAGHWSDRKIGLRHGFQQAAAGGVMAGIPSDPRGLAGGIGEAVERGNHVRRDYPAHYSAIAAFLPVEGAQRALALARYPCRGGVGGYIRAPSPNGHESRQHERFLYRALQEG